MLASNDAVVSPLADGAFRWPDTAEGRLQVAAQHPTYEYKFNHAIPGQLAAIHSMELSFVFGFFPKGGNLAGAHTDAA
jgi:hypothetical protein